MTGQQIENFIRINHYDGDSEAKVQMKVVSFINRFAEDNELEAHCNNNNLSSHSNNKAENKKRGAYNKRMGTKAGIPDIEIACPRGKNLYWELKALGGKLSPNQKKVITSLRHMNHEVLVTCGLRESIERFVCWYECLGSNDCK